MAYLPYRQQPESMEQLTLAIRTSGDPAALAGAVRAILRELAPSLPLYSVTTLDAQFGASVANERVMADVATAFAVAALLLVAVGVYGTLAYAAVRRRRELGLRLALGAERADIMRLLVTGALAPVAVGVAAGLPLSFVIGRVLQSTLFDVGSADPATYAGSLLTLIAVAVCAATLPALRASRANPVEVLREE